MMTFFVLMLLIGLAVLPILALNRIFKRRRDEPVADFAMAKRFCTKSKGLTRQDLDRLRLIDPPFDISATLGDHLRSIAEGYRQRPRSQCQGQ